jgi:hypothetical protein
VLAVATAAARALDLLDGDFQLHGFASLTLVNTTDNNFFGRATTRSARISAKWVRMRRGA